MSLTKEKIETLGNDLYDAWKDARQISALTDQVPDLSIEDAYQVQLQTVNRRVADVEMITGKKNWHHCESSHEFIGGQPA